MSDIDDDSEVFGVQIRRESRVMNQAYSAALQVWSQERTKQAQEETKQATERTRRTAWETARTAMAAIGSVGSLYVMARFPSVSIEALFAGVALAAPQALSSTLDRVRDLIAEKKNKPVEFPGPAQEKTLDDPGKHKRISSGGDGK